MKLRILAVVFVFLSVIGIVMLSGGGSAGADTVVSSLPWPRVPAGATQRSPSGACNLKLVLPGGGAGSDLTVTPWGFSEACNFAMPTSGSSAAALLSSTYGTDIPGATCTGAAVGCAVDAAGFVTGSSVSPAGRCGGNTPWDANPLGDQSWYSMGVGLAWGYNYSSYGMYGCFIQKDGTYPGSGTPDLTTCGGQYDWNGMPFWSDACTSALEAHSVGPGPVANDVASVCMVEFANVGTASGGYFPFSYRQDCKFILATSYSNTSIGAVGPGTDPSSCPNVGSYDKATAHVGTIYGYIGDVACVVGGSYANNEAIMPATYWVGGTANPGDCSWVQITPGSSAGVKFTAGTAVPFIASHTQYIAAVVGDPEDLGIGVMGSTAITGIPGVYHSDATGVANGGGAVSLTIPVTASITGTWFPEFFCLSQGGSIYQLGGPGGTGAVTCAEGADNAASCSPLSGTNNGSDCYAAGCVVDLTACLAQIPLGLAPSSWVPGLIHGAACLLTWALVPSSISTTALSDTFTSTFPGNWIATGSTSLGVIASGLNTAVSSSGACSAPVLATGPISVGGGHTPAVSVTLPAPESLGCSHSSSVGNVGDVFGYRGVIRGALTFALFLFLAFKVWGMMPWVKGKGDELAFGSSGAAVGEWDGDALMFENDRDGHAKGEM